MTNYILLHGSGTGPDMWFPWLKTELEKTGNLVWLPTIPGFTEPDLKTSLPFLIDSKKINSESVVICHSSSCPVMLSFLERVDIVIRQLVLVAPYFPMPGKKENSWQDKYDLEKIKTHIKEVVFVVSDNDPWGCTQNLVQPYFNVLGGTLVTIKGGGHFGSNTYKSPLYEFPLLLKLIDK